MGAIRAALDIIIFVADIVAIFQIVRKALRRFAATNRGTPRPLSSAPARRAAVV